MKRILLILSVLAAGLVLLGLLRGDGDAAGLNYRLVSVEQGDLESAVAATGTLDPVTTVQVGAQVSGLIERIDVDYNDPVKAGQVIARIDTTLLANAVAGAEAQLARAEAEARHAGLEYDRMTGLAAEDLVAESELNAAQYSLDSAGASVRSARADLDRARQNLQYATITSPIDGTVIARSVDVGQTVQSSFSAPELFLIAGDLTRMQILASVDESDIGQIRAGQTARFTVQAYPDDRFEGVVRQVRLQAATEENVVNYTAVIDVDNPDGRLLPGMTATVDFLVETATDVLYVSNAALRYTPDQEAMMEAFERMRAAREAAGAAGGPPPGGGGGAWDRGLLWTLDEDGLLTPVPVLTGISDGTHTAVTGRRLESGAQVIAGVTSGAATGQSSGSPFQQQGGARRPGPPSPGGF